MSADSVVIASVGMTTPVGLSATETAASVRSATARFVETEILDKGFQAFTLSEVPEKALPNVAELADGPLAPSARERRMLRLATRALAECLAPLGKPATPVGLCLALPEMETARPLDRAAFLSRLATQSGGAFSPAGSDASHVGRAGGLIAIGQAVLTIQSGLASIMIAGGVDSYHDLFVLTTLDRDERVKSKSNMDGFIPGEGACFLLLASEQAAAAQRLPVLGRVTPMASGFETGHLYSEEPYRGDGLATTFQQLVARNVVDAPIGEVYSSMTGENHWAKEWGVAHLRTKAAFRPDARMHHPADCYGDTGAASGPLMVGLAAMGIKESYRRSPAIVYGSSDRGGRAAVVVTV